MLELPQEFRNRLNQGTFGKYHNLGEKYTCGQSSFQGKI